MKYVVHFKVYASQAVDVEADSVEDAKEKANDAFEPVCLCWQCADKVEIGDDGEIFEVTEL